MAKSLPSRPDLEQLKKQAKDLLKSYRSGEPVAARRFRESRLGPQSVATGSAKLADAQVVIAHEYGFESWAKLKERVESIGRHAGGALELFKKAFHENDAAAFQQLLERHPEVKDRINDPIGPFDSPVITHVRSKEMLDVLLKAGADINARSRWWAGGFGLLDTAEPALAAYAIERGAMVDAHAAARLGMSDRLRQLVTANPELVHALGGDGQTPLHFASSIEIADLLLDRGAVIDARDVDHESTPAQYMIRDRQELARHLVRRGCQTDILMAAALGDMDLVRKHLAADPACIRMRVNTDSFPMKNAKAGGTIYQWTLGWHKSPHDAAKEFGHDQVYQFLIENSPADVKLIAACWAGDENYARTLVGEYPGLVSRLSSADRDEIANAARNNNTSAVRTMLAAGWPADALGQHRATALHWAAFHGNAEMAREILRYNPPLEILDGDFRKAPLGWAIHGSENGWYCRTGDYAGTVEALLDAGAQIGNIQPSGTEAVRRALQRFGIRE